MVLVLSFLVLHTAIQNESEWALLPGMFTYTRNFFSWQKLPQCNRMTVTEQKNTDNKKKNKKEQVNKE